MNNPFRPYDRLKDVGTRECADWRESIFQRHPSFMNTLVDLYEQRAKEHGHPEANTWLRETHESMKLGNTGLNIDTPEESLREYARAKARNIGRDMIEANARLGAFRAAELIRHQVETTGLAFPELPESPTKHDWVKALARVHDEQWWRRNLRVWQWREMEAQCRKFGLVNKRKGIYVGNFTFKRCQGQKASNRRLLESMEAENQDGQVYSLAELSDLSVSNPENRRGELMVRMNGFETFAKESEENWSGLFYTLTCPSKYHATHQSGHPNKKFKGATPQEANNYLNSVWQRVRAAWHRRDIKPYGFRVVEPHHDGTPHWHLMLFFLEHQVDTATKLFEQYALKEDGCEPGADKYRFKAVPIDPKKGSATGYIAKYIAKNIDGHGLDADLYGREAASSAARICAWASVWGIRQFQQIGGPSVTVWRELRRLEADGIEQELLKQITQAADDADWATYTELMGGVNCARKDRPLRPLMIEQPTTSKYGEVVKTLKGLLFGHFAVRTRFHEWTVRVAQSNADADRETEELTATQNKEAAQKAADFRAPPEACATLEFCQ